MVQGRQHHGPPPFGAAPRPAASQTGWLRAAFGAIKGLLGLIWAFAPEIIAWIFGVAIGLVVGVMIGAQFTGELFEGGGAWGRAGVVALILPLIAFVGPILMCVFLGATIPPTVTLAIHALVILTRSRDRTATRRLVVLTCAAGVFVPALLLAVISPMFLGGLAIGLMFSPITGPLGLLAGAAYCGARALLAGRSLGQWWRDADASMGVGMMTLSVVAWLGTWVPLAIVFLFPIVALALTVAIMLGFRLFMAGNRRSVVVAILVINLLHAALVGWLLVSVAVDMARDRAATGHAQASP